MTVRSALERKTFRRWKQPHPGRKLTIDQVNEIRQSAKPGTVLAKHYGVSHVTIWKVRHWRNYR
jgi:hypothetical protein